MPVRRRPLRGGRAFTLLELAIVIAVIVTLTLVVTVGLKAQARFSRVERTAREMASLLTSAFSVAARDLEIETGCTIAGGCTGNEPINKFAGQNLALGGLCYDLSCRAAPCRWNGTSTGAQPASDDTRLVTGASAGAGTGKNAYDNPYAVCVFRRKVVVATCVPSTDVPVEIGGAAAEPCPRAPFNFRCRRGERCVSTVGALSTPTLTRLGMRQRYLYWGEATDVP